MPYTHTYIYIHICMLCAHVPHLNNFQNYLTRYFWIISRLSNRLLKKFHSYILYIYAFNTHTPIYIHVHSTYIHFVRIWKYSNLIFFISFGFISVCNRTYYGDIGRTYALRVPPPQWNRLPFLCHITFTASGQEQGDIVQVKLPIWV